MDWTDDIKYPREANQEFKEWFNSQNLYFKVVSSLMFKHKYVRLTDIYLIYYAIRYRKQLPNEKRLNFLSDILKISIRYPARSLTVEEKRKKSGKLLKAKSLFEDNREDRQLFDEIEFQFKNQHIPEDIKLDTETIDLIEFVK